MCLSSNSVGNVTPGDVVIVQGVLMTSRRLGITHQHDLSFDTFIEGHKVINQKKKYNEKELSDSQKNEI